MKNIENAYGYYQRTYHRPHEDNDPSKPPLYWDGYQWVIRPNNNNFVISEPVFLLPDMKHSFFWEN